MFWYFNLIFLDNTCQATSKINYDPKCFKVFHPGYDYTDRHHTSTYREREGEMR